MRKRRISGLNDTAMSTVLTWGAIGFGIYYVVKNVLPNILPSLGVGATTAQQAAITTQISVPPDSNPFSYQFAPWIAYYNAYCPVYTTGGNAGSPVSMSDFFNGLTVYGVTVDASGNQSSIWSNIDTVALLAICQSLSSMFNTSGNDIQKLSGLSYQIQVSFIAGYDYYVNGNDFLTDLHGGFFTGMSAADLANLISKVNALPVSPGPPSYYPGASSGSW